MSAATTKTALSAAIEYAKRRWYVFPIRPSAKEPLTEHGFKDASTDEKQLAAWWKRWPNANVGIDCGRSRLLVLDIDPRHGGDGNLAQLLKQHGKLPHTVTCETGGGGEHYYFQLPEGDIRSSLRTGIDVKHDGGYVVAPPSDHASGNPYQWREGCNPGSVEVAELPAWLLKLVVITAQPTVESTENVEDRGHDDNLSRRMNQYAERAKPASKGERNTAAFSLAGHLASFTNGDGKGASFEDIIASLRAWNNKNEPPLPDDEIDQVVQSAMSNGTPRKKKPPEGSTTNEQECPSDYDNLTTIQNYKELVTTDGNGKPKRYPVPLSMSEIVDDIYHHSDNWPRRVDNVLFIDDPTHGIDWFDRRTTAGLFGWLRRNFKVDWKVSGKYVSQAELFAELERTAEQYGAIEIYPHEPPIDRHYYSCTPPKPGDGSALCKLLDCFRPLTPIDRDLIQSAVMTAFWGGPPGCRPAFVITADAGRGVGKTKLAEIIAYLVGGFIDVSAGEDISTLKQRFLSPEGQSKRVAMLDNVKSLRFSWAELESLITTPTISGKRMYVGEGQRPNTITWLMTLNGVSLATDLSQRSVIIKLAKGKNAGPWYENTIRFIDENRNAIIGDVVAALRAEPFPLAKYTRWAAWEQAVLSRLPEPGEAQAVILERQNLANCEQDEAEIIEEFFAEKLRKLNYDPDTAQVRIPVADVARWYGWAVGEKTKTAAVSKKLRQMANEGQLTRIAPDPSRHHGRCFIWTGRHADIDSPVLNDLSSRFSKRREKSEGRQFAYE